jgi:hypothetical protein
MTRVSRRPTASSARNKHPLHLQACEFCRSTSTFLVGFLLQPTPALHWRPIVVTRTLSRTLEKQYPSGQCADGLLRIGDHHGSCGKTACSRSG